MNRPHRAWRGILWLAFAAACEAFPPWDPYAGLSLENLNQTIVIEARRRGPEGGADFPAEPLLRIGVAEGDVRYQFSSIAGVHRLEDGRILVADGGSKELRLYSSEGRHLRSVGGPGRGPGEFEQILWLKALVNEEVLAWDVLAGRGSVFTTEGEFLRHVSLPEIPDYPLLFPENAFSDGSLLTQAGPPRDVVDAAGRRWKVVTVHRVELGGGSRAQVIGDFPSQLPQTESIWPKWQVGGDVIAYTRGDRPEVILLDPARGQLRVIRQGGANLPERSEPTIYFDKLRIDDHDHVWAHRAGTDSWLVFYPLAETFREYHVPADLTIHQITSDHVVGVERSELGVESVVVYQVSDM